MRPSTLLVFITPTLTGVVAAQGREVNLIKPAPCSDGLHALGLTSPPRSIELRATYDSARDSTRVTYARPSAAAVVRPRDGVNEITGLMYVPNRPPSELPPLELDLLVHSPAPRAPEERILTFQLDDSTTLGVGLAGAHPSVQLGGGGVNEHIISMISPADALQLLRANRIRGSLGTMKFGVSDQDRDGLRALVMYVRCGAR